MPRSPRKEPSFAATLLLHVAGADEDVLDLASTERKIWVRAGGMILTTAVLATVAATYTLHTIWSVAAPAAAVLAIGFGAAIMNIDGYLFASMRRQETPRKTILQAAPRVIVSVLLGFVISDPLLLYAFRGEIGSKTANTLTAEQGQAINNVDHQQPYAEIPQLKGQISTLVGMLGTLAASTPEQSSSYPTIARRYGKVFGQAHGNPNAPQVAPALAQLEALKKHISDQKDAAIAKASADLATAKQRLSNLTQARDVRVSELEQQYAGRTPGLAERTQALDDLIVSNPAVAFVGITLWLLLVAIDALPVSAKTIALLGLPTTYERIQRDREERSVETARQISEELANAEVEAATIDVRLARKLAEERSTRMGEAQRKFDETLIDRFETEILPDAEDWGREAAEEWRRAIEAAKGSRARCQI
jgi:hypothetical protein